MKKILSDYEKQEYLRIAKHEVGHYVANRTFNVIPDKIIFTYKPENGGNYIGGCQVTFCTVFESFDEIAEYCFQKSIVLVCGALAGVLDDKTKKVDLDSAKTRFKEYEVSDKAKLEENIKIHLGTNAKFFEENVITDAYNYTIEKLIRDLHESEKQKLLRIIHDEVIDPAIASPELDEKIKASVNNTAERLSKKTSAREIVDFFNDALLANKGKEIYQAFHKIGLKGFEDIDYLIEEAYYS